MRQCREREERGDLIEPEREPWLSEWVEGAGCREIVDRLGLQMPVLQAEMRSANGLSTLDLSSRLGLLHVLIEQVLVEDRDIWKRMEPADIAGQRASLLGRDASGRWHYALAALESRVYSLASTWQKKPLPTPPHLVRVGERVEVEVAEKELSIEWRGAKVLELLPGGKGRFVVMVDGVDGLPDEDFIEVFTTPLLDKEWRKMPKKEVKPKEVREERAPPEARGGARRTRVTEKDESPAAASSAPHPSKKQKVTVEEKVELQLQQVALLCTANDGKALMLLPPAPSCPKPKSSDPKADKEVHKAILELGAEQEVHAAAYARLYQQSVIRLHEHVQQAAADRAAAAAAPLAPAAEASADPWAENLARVQAGAALDADTAAAVKVGGGVDVAEKAKKVANDRAARSAKRLQISQAEFEKKHEEELKAEEQRKRAKLEATSSTAPRAPETTAAPPENGGGIKVEDSVAGGVVEVVVDTS